jgi:ABC-type dipeptide/oligopeptide/nickel transport system permease subunit
VRDSIARRIVRRLLRDNLTMMGLVMFVALTILSFLAPAIAPYPYERFVGAPLQPPGPKSLLGTDEIGRDIFSRMLYGGRTSLTVGMSAALVALAAGLPLGLISGYYGGIYETVIMRVMDGLLAFPGLMLALAAIAVLGPNLRNTIIAIAIVSVPVFSRLTRASVLIFKEREFVQAVRGMGAGDPRILLRTILPHAMPPLTVQFSLSFANAVLAEAGLSFLGLGVQPPLPSWGMMLNTGKNVMAMSPQYPVIAGAAVFLVVLSLNLVGDGLRDALDPFQITRPLTRRDNAGR